jgi:N-acetyl-gamma-glutamyl-phosphate reductase
MGISVGVLGASGYSGGECLRLLAAHPGVDLQAVGADRRAGEQVATLHPHLAPLGLGAFSPPEEVLGAPLDVLFSCLPGGALDGLGAPSASTVIDLADDHRGAPGWVYGLVEWARSELPARRIANPGCYPTATLLATLPFAKEGLLEGTVIVDAMSGASGAGRSAADHLGFAHLHGSVTAYGTTSHRHVPEMERGLESFGSFSTTVSFTPHLVPQARGLLVTARAALSAPLDDAKANEVLVAAYEDEPFVHVVDGWPTTKAVAGSNHAHVSAHVDTRAGFLVMSAAIDNLGKGAAGQAVQNMNAAFGIDEATGLEALGVWP